MSKMDGLRAMREAKYAAAQKRSSSAPARPAAKAPVAPPAAAPESVSAPPSARAKQPAATDVEPTVADELCGHRNMSGRTCTRERGHAAKSHRYS